MVFQMSWIFTEIDFPLKIFLKAYLSFTKLKIIVQMQNFSKLCIKVSFPTAYFYQNIKPITTKIDQYICMKKTGETILVPVWYSNMPGNYVIL